MVSYSAYTKYLYNLKAEDFYTLHHFDKQQKLIWEQHWLWGKQEHLSDHFLENPFLLNAVMSGWESAAALFVNNSELLKNKPTQ